MMNFDRFWATFSSWIWGRVTMNNCLYLLGAKDHPLLLRSIPASTRRSAGDGSCVLLHPAALARPAAVVRDGSHILDPDDLDPRGRERTDRRLASRPGALHEHIHANHAVV